MRYEVVSPLALYDAMSQHQNTLNKQNAALGMMQTNGWGGGAGILGAALGGLLANKYSTEANQQQAEIAKQQFLYEQQQHRLAQEAQAQAAELKREQKLEDDILAHERAMELATAKANAPTTKMREAASMGLQPNSPEYAKFMSSGGQTINVGGDKTSPFAEALGKKNAEKYNTWETEAYSANETLASIQNLRAIGQMQKTGKMQQALGAARQWLGDEAGANMQAYGAITAGLVLQQAEKLKGAMSDGDIKLLEATMPSFGNDPRANEVIYGILEKAANRSIERFEGAANHFQKHGDLQRYRPKFDYSARSQQAAKPEQTQDYTKMSDDELMAAWKAKQGK